MKTVSALELRKRLGAILNAASAGERIVIERDRRPLAVLVSYEDAQRLEESRDERYRRAIAALDRLEALGERLRREYPQPAEGPDAVTAVREARDERVRRLSEHE